MGRKEPKSIKVNWLNLNLDIPHLFKRLKSSLKLELRSSTFIKIKEMEKIVNGSMILTHRLGNVWPLNCS